MRISDEVDQLILISVLSCDYSTAVVNVAGNDARFEQAIIASEGALVPCTELPEIPLPRGHKGMRTLSSVRNRAVPEDIEQAYQRRETEVAQLRRCSRCVLPETMPFIEFDSDGVCSICRSYRPISVAGPEKLQELADRHRSHDGSPDCIAAISGGRDSTYGLHYLKRELGLNPIAYTYDWGMVTDLARRNQARITGKLGVEHIIISADIQTKRRNIANNVLAWLKRPDLGMIPLFMAGDKQFYYYANVVRKQTQVPLLFFSAGNEIEATGFKTGFCGIRQGPEQGLLSSMTIANKLRLIAHYGKEFALNPAYISRSLVDTAHAFFSSYVMKHDYHYLFHYLYWDEEQIMDVLMNEYDWQVATDTSATWRIGDGTAAFYNYIYYMVAGLTENDTFRSNQIREGKMDRDTAVALSKEENHPRYDTIQEYLDLIGIEFESTLRTIAAITPLEQR